MYMNDISVREFEEADRDVLRHLFVESRDAAFVWAPAGTHKLEDFDQNTRGERIIVAVLEDVPVGFASVWVPESFLHSLFVHPVFQGRGVGKALLAACDKYFSGTPTLKCLKANVRATHYYQNRGWRIRSEEEGPDGAYYLMAREPAPASPAGT